MTKFDIHNKSEQINIIFNSSSEVSGDEDMSAKFHYRGIFVDKNLLRRENAKLRASITCLMCKRNRVQSLFLPCRHVVACLECWDNMDLGMKTILGTVKIY